MTDEFSATGPDGTDDPGWRCANPARISDRDAHKARLSVANVINRPEILINFKWNLYMEDS